METICALILGVCIGLLLFHGVNEARFGEHYERKCSANQAKGDA